MSSEEKDTTKTLSDVALTSIMDDDEKDECRENEDMLEAGTRKVYDIEKNEFDFGRRRTTDLKKNAHVIFPKSRDFQMEAKFKLL